MASRESSPANVPTTSQAASPSNPPPGRGFGGSGLRIQPGTPSEWLCYTVLHHANLLQYYSTFIAQGGDDVPQLMEAQEEEFLEIMALVGMAQKPLHVRRLQKALQEYSINPNHFRMLSLQHQAAAAGHGPLALFPTPSTSISFTPSTHGPLSDISLPRPSAAAIHRRQPNPSPRGQPSPSSFSPAPPTTWTPPATTATSTASVPLPPSVPHSTPPPRGSSDTPGAGEGGSEFEFGSEGSVVGPSPGLTEEQVARITACTRAIIPNVPHYEPKLVQNKKKISPALKAVMDMPSSAATDERRTEEYRRYAAIYGRFDAKRKADKPLTLHEVVRDAGYNYAKPGTKRGMEEEEEASGSRKRGTPDESTGSSGGRSQTPGSSNPGSPVVTRPPPPSGLHQLGLAATHLAMQGSPSSSGTSAGSTTLHPSASLHPSSSAPLLSTGLHYFQGAGTSMFAGRYRGLGRTELTEKLESVRTELARVMEKQKVVEKRVMTAADISACITTNAELRTLAQRQVELLNEQAGLEALLKETPLLVKTEKTSAEPEPESGEESEEVEVGSNQPSDAPNTPPPRMTRLASKRERL